MSKYIVDFDELSEYGKRMKVKICYNDGEN